MKTTLLVLLISTVTLANCGGGKRVRNQENYDVVEEGSADGVTSTIHAPGETPPPLTDTNADTTTAFTLTDTMAPNTAGTLPPTTMTVPPLPPPPTPHPQPTPPPTHTTTEPEPPPTDTTTTDTAEPGDEDEDEQQEEKPENPPPPPPSTEYSDGLWSARGHAAALGCAFRAARLRGHAVARRT
ncbi:MAG TPA: hypothetical protein VMU84_12215 [Thermoanaerobaculia bacterium]|nr:hypothetical protein [Thermoanaerobaculia bacterium]